MLIEMVSSPGISSSVILLLDVPKLVMVGLLYVFFE